MNTAAPHMTDPASLDWDDDSADDDFLTDTSPAPTPNACDIEEPDCDARQ